MNPVSNEAVRHIKNFRASSDLNDFSNKYGHGDGNFAEALYLCIKMISKSLYKLCSSQIVIFTDKHQPNQPGSTEFQQTFEKAKELQQLRVNLVVVPFTAEFDENLFWKQFICTVLDCHVNDFKFTKFSNDRQVLINCYCERCLKYFIISIEGKVKFGAVLYNSSIKNIKKINETYTGTKYQEFGQEKIFFRPEEIDSLNNLMEPSEMRLLGFKSGSHLLNDQYLKTSSFIYPDETQIKGSTCIFSALWQKCIEKDKIAICILVSSPLIFAFFNFFSNILIVEHSGKLFPEIYGISSSEKTKWILFVPFTI